MTTALKLRRGTTTQHASFTGADGEVTVDTTKKTVVVHDGSTAGGVPLMKESGSATGANFATSSGNVGIGTSSPAQRLDATVSSATEGSGLAVTNSLIDGYGSGISLYSTASDNTKILAGRVGMRGTGSWANTANASSAMAFSTASAGTLSERMRITSAGEVLVGTTTALSDTNAAIQIAAGTNASRYFSAGKGTGYGALFGYENGSGFGNGVMIRSVQTGDPIMFLTNNTNERMRIDASGNLLVGTNSSGYAAANRGIIQLNGATNALIGLSYGGTNGGYVYSDANGNTFWAEGNRYINIGVAGAGYVATLTNNQERMRIAANGDVFINGTSMPTGMGGSFLVNGGRPLSYSTGEGALFMKADAGGWQMGTYIIGSSGTRRGGFGFAGAGDALSYLWAGQSGSGVGVQLPPGNNSWSALSDIREKVVHGLVENALDKVAAIRPIYYNYNSDTNENPRRVGFIAQEVQLVFPEAVTELQMNTENPTEETKRLSLAYTDTIPLLLAAIQELKSELDSVKSELANLKGN